MPTNLSFDIDTLNSIAGGRSAIEIPRLHIHHIEDADAFLKAYGFDYSTTEVQDRLWYFHRRAIVLLTERLGYSIEELPEVIRERRMLGDLRQLLIYASLSAPEDRSLQRWACAFLRCMHVFVHAETDLFSSFAEEIQSQILTPLQNAIVHDGTNHKTFLRGEGGSQQESLDRIELVRFEQKPFKTSQSTVIKLLARPEALAMKIFDKLGVRFVTKNMFDAFRVIRFLVNESLVAFPHIMPDQSSNNMYPIELLVKVCEEAKHQGTSAGEELNSMLEARLIEEGLDAKMLRKPNDQTSQDFKFIKFIARKLIEVPIEGRGSIRFFYPYEIQIMCEKDYLAMQSGPSEHEAYKERQRQAARERLFPEKVN